MNHIDTAADAFANGYNCAQSVLVGYCSEFGLDKDNATKVSAGFGGGMRMAGTCGALTGALMVIGLRYASTDPKDTQNKALTIEKIKLMTKMFKDAHGSTECRELLGCDVSTPEGSAHAQKHNIIKKTCPNFVKSAAKILDEIL